MTDNPPKPLTPKEVRETLDVTDATVRNYCKRFGKFLTPEATRKTRKRFSPDDLKVLRLAKSYLDDQYTYDQVSNILESTNLDDILDQPLPQTESIDSDREPDPDQTSALAIYRETLDAKNETIDILKKEIKWLRTPWYKKIFRDPPE